MQTNEIFNHYKNNFDKNLSNDKLLDWENQDAQFARFNILREFLIKNSILQPTLLDVGCGTADLYNYLLKNDIKLTYTGVDILPQMVFVAKNQHPDLNIQCADIFKDNTFSTKFDIVYSSGIFNIDLGNNYEFLTQAITRFLYFSIISVKFNSISLRIFSTI